MDLPEYEPPADPDYTPRPNPIFSEPATPAACARDYDAAAHVRATLDKQERTR